MKISEGLFKRILIESGYPLIDDIDRYDIWYDEYLKVCRDWAAKSFSTDPDGVMEVNGNYFSAQYQSYIIGERTMLLMSTPRGGYASDPNESLFNMIASEEHKKKQSLLKQAIDL